jgi:hypothetical protein
MNYQGGGIDFKKNATRPMMPPPPMGSTNFFGGGTGARFYGPAVAPPPSNPFDQYVQAGNQMVQQSQPSNQTSEQDGLFFGNY